MSNLKKYNQKNTSYLPNRGTWSDVRGIVSATLSRKRRKDSRAATPICTFCCGVQKNMDKRTADVRIPGRMTFII